MTVLNEMEIQKSLENLKSWEFSEDAIRKTFSFKNHLETLSFLNAVAFYSEKVAHHPQVNYCYNTATLSYQTHDAGNKVTEKDLLAARYLEELMKN